MSPSAWILPLNADISIPLVNYGGFINGIPDQLDATSLVVRNLPPVVFNQASIVSYPIDELVHARRCAKAIYSEKSRREDTAFSPIADFITTEAMEMLLSENGDLLVVADSTAQYIFFKDVLRKSSSKMTQLVVDSLHDLLALTDGPSEIKCPWDELTDDTFEELCYDIILYRYSSVSSIQKMGKSRSRDGGRDIVFEVKERAGHPPTKWIAQCKLMRNNGSLSGQKINVSDTLDQYGATGFLVMTSGIIDATLTDKLDRIATRRAFHIDQMSRLELERFLARHPMLRSHYF